MPGSHLACPYGTGTSRAGQRWGLGRGQGGTDAALAVTEHAAAARDLPGEKPLWSRRGGSSAPDAHKAAGRALRGRHRGAAAKRAGAAPAPRGRSAPRRWRSGNFHTRCSTGGRRAGGGAEAGAIREPQAPKARAGIIPAAPSPGPGADSRFSRALGQWQELLLSPEPELQASFVLTE